MMAALVLVYVLDGTHTRANAPVDKDGVNIKFWWSYKFKKYGFNTLVK